MKELNTTATLRGLIKNFIDQDISRREFLSSLSALGLSCVSSNAFAEEFTPFVTRTESPDSAALPEWVKRIEGTGGKLLVEQLKAAGNKYIFVNPSSGATPIFDALVDDVDIQLIVAVQEGSVAAMADGYARASGETPLVMIARPGLPNAMTQIYNAWKDNIPMVVVTDVPGTEALGQNFAEEVEHMDEMTRPITKWHWTIESIQKIPEMLRRATKFSSTKPGGPTFLAIPENLLSKKAVSAVMDQSKFSVPMKINPDGADIEAAAKMLLKAQNPLLYLGDEVTISQGQSECLELAELLSLPVTASSGIPITWSKPFPSQHDLFLGPYQPTSRFPGRPDVMMNIGGTIPIDQ